MQTRNLIALKELGGNRFSQRFLGGIQWLVEPVCRFGALNEVYRNYLKEKSTQESVFDTSLKAIGGKYHLREEDLLRIPKTGPIVLVANHPFGGIDGIILGSILQRVRPDGKMLVNYMLDRIEGMGENCIYVNPFGSEKAKRENFSGLKQSLQWLKNGGALATFPAGEVSHFNFRTRKVTDPLWAENLASIIMKTGATVVPVYFSGQNRLLFQIAGMLHPRLRTALLPREMLNRKRGEIHVRIGNPISSKRLSHFTSTRDCIEFLRLRTYILKNREASEKTSFVSDTRKAHTGKPVIEARPVEKMEAEIQDLPARNLLAEQGDFAVYYARAADIPSVVLQLGRLRELTFRAVGEGTGLERDLDEFDSYYLHLFMWNRAEKEIVGAYRMGLTDEILPRHGKSGLYTSTLFRYRSGVIAQFNPAIELGRSFVVEKYQRKPVSLSLIWRGIGQFIVQNPKYKTLFGPVTISKEYQSLSKNLIVAYLREHTLDAELAAKVKAKRPPRSRFFGSLDKSSFKRSVRDIEDVSALISEIESDERGVPVLLRQYLKLNALMLSFNVDPEFNDCIDGLVLVDLTRTPERTLQRYLGREGAQRFLDFHTRIKGLEEKSATIPVSGIAPLP